MMLNDITRCVGVGCSEREHCMRCTTPVPERTALSWAGNLNHEQAPECPYFIPETRND